MFLLPNTWLTTRRPKGVSLVSKFVIPFFQRFTKWTFFIYTWPHSMLSNNFPHATFMNDSPHASFTHNSSRIYVFQWFSTFVFWNNVHMKCLWMIPHMAFMTINHMQFMIAIPIWHVYQMFSPHASCTNDPSHVLDVMFIKKSHQFVVIKHFLHDTCVDNAAHVDVIKTCPRAVFMYNPPILFLPIKCLLTIPSITRTRWT